MKLEWAAAAAAFFVAAGCVWCAASVPEKTGQETLDYAAKLRACQDVGRDADSYRVYEACTKEAGL